MLSNSPRTFSDMLGETAPLIGAVAFFGPPVIFFAAPWLVLGLALSGPFMVVLTLVAALVVAVALVVALAALVAMPFVMIRRWRAAHVPVAVVAETTSGSVVQVQARQVIA